METIIRRMIRQAEIEENYSLIEYARQLINECADTINCPSNWRSLGEELAREYYENNWVYDNLELWNYME